MHHVTRFARAALFRLCFPVTVVAAAAAACSSTTTGSSECDNLDGKYVITADCLERPLLCDLSQDGCSGTVACSEMDKTEVKITQEDVRFTLNVGPCVGAPTENGINGACTSGDATCDFQGVRLKLGQCGLTWSEGQDPPCDGCAEAHCCDELKACAPGTACNTLLVCLGDACPDRDPTCLLQATTQACSAESAAGGSDAEALRNCVLSACAGCGA